VNRPSFALEIAMLLVRALLVSLLALLSITVAPRPARAQPVEETLSMVGLGEGPFDKEAARARFEVEQTSLADAKRALLAVAYQLFRASRHHPLPGVSVLPEPGPDEAPRLLAAAELLANGPAARVTALEGWWWASWEAEQYAQLSYEARRTRATDYFWELFAHLEAAAALAEAGSGPGQPSLFSRYLPLREEPITGPLEAKELARARFEVSRARPANLRRDRAKAAGEWARACWEDEWPNFQAHPDRVSAAFEAMPQLLAAEKDAEDTPAARLALEEGRWRVAWERERLARVELDAGRWRVAWWRVAWERGRVAGAVFAARFDRLEAEAELLEARPGQPSVLLWERLAAELGPPLAAKELARARFEASQGKVGELAAARRQAVLQEVEQRFQGLLAGAGGLDLLQKSIDRAGRALAVGGPEARRRSLEEHWRWAWELDRFIEAAHEAGRARVRDHLATRYDRRMAELMIVAAREEGKKPAPEEKKIEGKRRERLQQRFRP
jgi:hypothetical protein